MNEQLQLHVIDLIGVVRQQREKRKINASLRNLTNAFVAVGQD